MTWVAAGVGTAAVGASLYNANQAGDASKDAANVSGAYQQNNLDYMKQLDALPIHMRDQASNILGSWYGLDSFTDPSQRSYSPEEQGKLDYIQGLKQKIAGDTGGSLKYDGQRMSTGSAITQLQQLENEAKGFGMDSGGGAPGSQMGGQQQIIDQVMNSPFYQQNIQQGEEAIGRNAAATGGMRGGNIQEGLAQNSQNVLQDMTYAHLGGLQQFSNPSLNTGGIAGANTGIGNAMAGGQLGSANAMQQGLQGAMDIGGQLAGAYIGRPQQPQAPGTPGTTPGAGSGTSNYQFGDLGADDGAFSNWQYAPNGAPLI